MDLGLIPYRCQDVNALHGAVHPDNGVVWTEGKGIFLSPLLLHQGQLENPEHNKLGEFDRGVKSVHWGDNVAEGLCYMCVVHDKNISIWKVEGHQPRLSFKQVRKVNIQPIQQGCLWNPGRDILCVLCPQQASLYYSHLKNKGSQVLVQLDRDKIRCGCWLTDGSRLVLCVGTTLSIYTWTDIDQNLSHCTYIPWTIPRLTGSISAIVPVSYDKFLYVAEVPLESLVKIQDTFLIPDFINGNIGNKLRDDGEIIRPTNGKESSITESLFNIPRNPDAVIEDSSRLDLIQLHTDRDPDTITGCNIKGVVTPDILLYQPEEQLVVVGSNSQPLLQVFSLDQQQLTKYSEILLDKNERPKGIASYPSDNKGSESGILVLVGKKESSDFAFPSSTNTTTMKSVLKFFNLKQGRLEKNQLTHTKSAPSIPLSVAANGHRDKNIDYDLITHQVINFNPAITKSVDNVNRNGNSIKPREEITYHNQTIDSKSRSDQLKESAVENKENGYHENHTESEHKEGAEPPKRPVRKKKSLRGKQDLVDRNSVASVQRPLMEYQSDSSDVSPREVHVKTSQTKTDGAPVVSILKEHPGVGQNSASLNTGNEPSGVNSAQGSPNVASERARLERQRKIHSSSLKSETSDEKLVGELKLEPVTSVSEDFSREITLSLSKDTNTVLTNGILELGETDSKKELEVEMTSFDSERRNFKTFDNKKFQESSELSDTKVQRYLSEKATSAKTIYDKPVMSEQRSDKPVKVEQRTADHSEHVNVSGSLKNVGKQSLSLESLEDIDRLLKEQNEKITKLQEQMTALSRRVDESSCVLPTRYLSVTKPDVVHVVFRCKDGFEIKRKFLLDGGRLQLEQVKQAFSLETVEIYIEDEPCVAGCNIDGYIPLRFESDSIIYISGKPAI